MIVISCGLEEEAAIVRSVGTWECLSYTRNSGSYQRNSGSSDMDAIWQSTDKKRLLLVGNQSRDDFGDIVSKFEYEAFVSFCIAGSVSPRAPVGAVVLPVHIISPDAPVGPTPLKVVSGYQFIATPKWTAAVGAKFKWSGVGTTYTAPLTGTSSASAKAILKKQFPNVDTVDELVYKTAFFAWHQKSPFVSIQAISDAWNQSLPAFAENVVNPQGETNVIQTIEDFIRDPSQVLPAIEVAASNDHALSSLRQIYQAVGPDFAFPGG